MVTQDYVPVGEWSRAADEIENLSRAQKCLGKYRRLVSELRRKLIGERCGERAFLALKKLRF